MSILPGHIVAPEDILPLWLRGSPVVRLGLVRCSGARRRHGARRQELSRSQGPESLYLASWPPVFESVAGVLGAEGWSGWWGALEILILTRSDSQYGFGPVPPWVPVSSSVEETADQILLCCQAVPCFDVSLYLLDAGDHLSPLS